MLLPVLVLAAAGAGAVLRVDRQPAGDFDPLADKQSICSADNPFSSQPLLGEPRHAFKVDVPQVDPLPGQGHVPAFAVRQGDIIQVEIAAPRAGSVAMHGVMDPHRVKVGGTVFLKLQARYSGRFPLHFHGDEGAHIEVAVFEVMPTVAGR
jgi:hypothetical protein